MVDRRVTEVVVLAEDLRSFNLIRQSLMRSGRYRNIRPSLSPRADGSAEQWVRQQFPIQLRAFRAARSRRAGALVVHIDADGNTADDRLQQLRAACTAAAVDDVGPDELVAFLVPKWSTETWIIWLTGGGVQTEDETVKYKCDDCDRKIRPAADRVFALTRTNATTADSYQPSFAASLPEWRKVM